MGTLGPPNYISKSPLISPVQSVCLTSHVAKPQVPSPVADSLVDQILPFPTAPVHPKPLAVVAGPKLLQQTNLQGGQMATGLWTLDMEKWDTNS